MAQVQPKQRAPIETGAPDPLPLMHPVMRKNYGQWIYHDHPRPGVLMHRAKSGEEIWVDKYGRIKVLFHWDRYGKADETASCWIRVSSARTSSGTSPASSTPMQELASSTVP